MGMTGYYQKFIEGYITVAAMLTDLSLARIALIVSSRLQHVEQPSV